MRTQKGEDDAGDSELSFYASSMQISPEQTPSVLPLFFFENAEFPGDFVHPLYFCATLLFLLAFRFSTLSRFRPQ